jgi:hypothetical protein
MGTKLNDNHIRAAARSKLLAAAGQCADTLIVEELGLAHGAVRVDIAVINGHIRALEIKGDADTLARLPRQAEAYGQVADRASLIATERHLDKAAKSLPVWWGLIMACPARDEEVTFRCVRPEKANRQIDPITLAKLMWRTEVVEVLRQMGAEKRLLGAPRAVLYPALVGALSAKELADTVRRTLKTRERWRDRARPSPGDGSFLPIATS